MFIVSSGEMMALYAADNIAHAVRNFASRGYMRIMAVVQQGLHSLLAQAFYHSHYFMFLI